MSSTPLHPDGVTADLRTWPLLDSCGESTLAQLLCMGISGSTACFLSCSWGRAQTLNPKGTQCPFFREIRVLWRRLLFPLECQFSLQQIDSPRSGGNFECALVTPMEIETQTLSSHWHTHVCIWVFSFEQPLCALQMDIVFSPEMSFSSVNGSSLLGTVIVDI